MKKNIDNLYKRIEDCCDSNLRFSGVTQLRMLKWLDNFSDEDRHKALTVAEKISYISERDIYDVLRTNLHLLIEKSLETDKFFFIPNKIVDVTDGTNKSSQLIAYYLKKVIDDLPTNEKNRITLLSNSRMGKNHRQDLQESVLIVYDDYIGSGNQVKNFIQRTILGTHQQYYSNLKDSYIMSLYISESGYKILTKELPDWEIISNQRKKAFARRGSIFGYEPKMKEIREFCYKYGKQFSTSFYDKEMGKKKTLSIPLGFNNTQELISFCYRTPNNTIPIIWESKNDWFPLLPRYSSDIIASSKEYRKESAYLLHKTKNAIGNKSKLILRTQTKDGEQLSISQNNILLFSVMRLKKKKSDRASICQKLDLRHDEYENILNEGIAKDIFDKEGEFTISGNIEYDKIMSMKEIYDDEDFWKKNFKNPKDLFYLPKKINRKA